MREGAGGREKIPGENERVRERERERGRRARRSSSRRRDEELTTGASERLEKRGRGNRVMEVLLVLRLCCNCTYGNALIGKPALDLSDAYGFRTRLAVSCAVSRRVLPACGLCVAAFLVSYFLPSETCSNSELSRRVRPTSSAYHC